MIVTSRPSLRTQTHLSYACNPSSLRARGTAAKCVSVPMFEERLGVGVQEASEPSDGVSGTIRAVVVVPAGYLALVLVAARVRGDAEDGFVGSAATEAALAV